MNSICVYCGSSDNIKPEYLQAAREMGQVIADQGLQLWYGAGSTGLMGELANGALEAGGQVIGVIPEIFNTPVLVHEKLSKLEVVGTMHQRKQYLADQADAFIALPGGFGTFEELFEILTWAQIGLHQKPVGLLNTLSYFDALLELVNQALSEGFIYSEHKALFCCAEYPSLLLETMTDHTHPLGLERWLTRED
jgi:uncharacterized protein (TIGR00730 family)